MYDDRLHVIIATESHVTKSKMGEAALSYSSLENCFRLRDEMLDRGGGGGILILVHDGVPYVEGYNAEVALKNETDRCRTTVFPNYNSEHKLDIVEAFRPSPKKAHPFEEAPRQALARNDEQQTARRGELSINSG